MIAQNTSPYSEGTRPHAFIPDDPEAYRKRLEHAQRIVNEVDQVPPDKPQRIVIGEPGKAIEIVDAASGVPIDPNASQYCEVEGCRMHIRRRDLCGTHYKRWADCGYPDRDEWMDAGAVPPGVWFAMQGDTD